MYWYLIFLSNVIGFVKVVDEDFPQFLQGETVFSLRQWRQVTVIFVEPGIAVVDVQIATLIELREQT